MTSPLVQALAFQNSVNPAQTGVAPTDVVGAYKLASDVAEKNYQAKIAQMMGMWGGLASLGSAGILGFAPRGLGASALSKLFSSGGAAGGAGAASGGSGILTGGAALGIPQADFDAANAGLASSADLGGGASLAGLTGGTVGDIGSAAAPTVASDLGLSAPAAGTLAGDFGGAAGADAAGSMTADLGATGAADAGLGLAADTAPDWLSSFLPFLFA